MSPPSLIRFGIEEPLSSVVLTPPANLVVLDAGILRSEPCSCFLGDFQLLYIRQYGITIQLQ